MFELFKYLNTHTQMLQKILRNMHTQIHITIITHTHKYIQKNIFKKKNLIINCMKPIHKYVIATLLIDC